MSAKIAELQQRVKFQSLSRTSDGQGGWIETWTDFAEVWAKVKPVSAKERYFSQRIEENISHQITIRWRNDLNTEMRILYESRIFQLHGIRDEDERHWFTLIDAEEGVGS